MKVGLVSLGCSKNLVDSEYILGWFKANKHSIVTDLNKAEVLLVNTCGFIEPAKKESIETILDLAKYKSKNAKHLIVTGCLIQRYQEELISALPEVDAWVPIERYHEIEKIIDPVLGILSEIPYGQYRLQSTLKHTAYLKIAEGCSNKCSFCAIPLIRKKAISVPLDELVDQAKALVKEGVKELVLIAQDTSRYGEDLGKNQLLELLQALNEIEGLTWIRMLYLYPQSISKSFLDGMKQLDKVLPYFDIPMQHADDTVLKRMFRRGTSKNNREIIQYLRNLFPNAILRTTVIVGFPGETEAQFQTLLDFVEEMGFDRLGAFTYSPEENTKAYEYEDDVPKHIKEERLHRLMSLQARISESKMSEHIGKTFRVMVEDRPSKSEYYVGRTYGMAPDDVDGEVKFSSTQLHSMGDFVEVKVTEVSSFDLIGEAVA